MDAFIGTINAKTDVKGRVFVPASFRKILQSSGEAHLVLRKDVYQDCLILYPEKVWKEELNRLRARLNEWDEEEQHLFRQFSWLVESLDLDSNGRILIPKKYLQMARISNAICFVGMNTTIELWNPDQLAESMLSAEDLKSRVKKLLSSKPANEKPDKL
ncbi:MAG: cell division/cell wall cluster transcriptional repressor MraZ [Candidatus Azobacteroides sp.]|nr:cell division/cell wall cluster transcriptional repressor MraZ [Candidatus Azobacteroides sp.]